MEETKMTTEATDATAAPIAEQNTEATESVAKKKERPDFSPEQEAYFQKTINAEFAKLQAKADKKLQELQEAEKLKNMSEGERQTAELEKARSKIAEFERRELVNQFKIELTEKGLPSDFANFVNVGDAEKAKAAVDFFTSFKSKLEAEQAEKIAKLEEELRNASLRGQPPKNVSPTAQKNGISKMGNFMNELINKEN